MCSINPDEFNCSKTNNISKVYLLNYSDCVFQKETLVRIKRKTKNNKREVLVLDYNKIK
jgi:hypothetical protein